MQASSGTIVTVALALALILGACSGGDGASDTTARTDDTVVGISDLTSGVVELAVDPESPGYIVPIDPASEYITALCTIDFDAAYASDAPIANVLEQLRLVPTGDSDEAAELEGIVDVLQSVDGTQLNDTNAFAAVIEVGVILEARCG